MKLIGLGIALGCFFFLARGISRALTRQGDARDDVSLFCPLLDRPFYFFDFLTKIPEALFFLLSCDNDSKEPVVIVSMKFTVGETHGEPIFS